MHHKSSTQRNATFGPGQQKSERLNPKAEQSKRHVPETSDGTPHAEGRQSQRMEDAACNDSLKAWTRLCDHDRQLRVQSNSEAWSSCPMPARDQSRLLAFKCKLCLA